MQKKNRLRRAEQLNMFHPPRVRPAWLTLPMEVRQKTMRLLADMLRDYQAKGVGNE